MALADSYGMKYEFVPHTRDKDISDLFHEPNVRHAEYQKGHYSDDTQMSMANLELLIKHRGNGKNDAITQDEFIKTWLEVFKRDPHLGYSKRMWQVLSEAKTPDDFKNNLDASNGVTSGGAMRAGPFGLLSDVEEVKTLALAQARITHDTPAGRNAALAVALSVHFLYHGGERQELPAFLKKHIGLDLKSAEAGFVDDMRNGLRITTDALDAVVSAKSLSGVLLNIVNAAEVSDTDTICAMAMVIAACAPDLEDDLPQKLRDGLEKGPYGAGYLKQLDQKARQTFPPSQQYKKSISKHLPHKRPPL